MIIDIVSTNFEVLLYNANLITLYRNTEVDQ